jgi:hypothetical protein
MSKRAIPTWAVLAVCCIAQFMVVLDSNPYCEL